MRLFRATTAVAVSAVIVSASVVASGPSDAAAAGVVPTQFIAKVFTEGLGRAPEAAEWNRWVAFFEGAGCSRGSLARFGEAVYTGQEFLHAYPEATAKRQRVIALVRGALSHDPSAGDWSAYYTNGYARDTSWDSVVGQVFAAGSAFDTTLVDQICDPGAAGYGFPYQRPLDVLGGSRSQQTLQAELDATAPGGTVSLRPAELIRVRQHALRVPAGVTLTTAGSPAPVAYASMARIVPDGQTCAGSACVHTAIVLLGKGAKLQNVWVDGAGAGAGQVQTANVETENTAGSGGTQISGDRFTDPGPSGTAIRLDGFGTTGVACHGVTVSGNVITGYAGSHRLDSLGRAQWASGITDQCEDATITGNQLVDLTDSGITIYGQRYRLPEQQPPARWDERSVGRTQQSRVTKNAIIATGNAMFAALAADPDGDCLPALTTARQPGRCTDLPDTKPVGITPQPPELPATTPDYRDFTGSRVSDNTYWTSSRTSMFAGLLIGSRAMLGDSGPTGVGATFAHNTVPVAGTRVNTAIITSGMFDISLRDNTTSTAAFALVDGNPGIDDNKCPQQIWGYNPAAASFTSGSTQVPPQSANPWSDCMIASPPAAMDRIVVAPDGQHLQGATTGARFTPYGQNYGLDPGTAPDEGGILDPRLTHTKLVHDFRVLKHEGSNTVRFMVTFSDIINPPATLPQNCSNEKPGDGKPNQDNLARLKSIVEVAGQLGLYVDVTGLYEPSITYAPCWYDSLSTEERWQVQARYWTAIATTLKSETNVLDYDLMNEPVVAIPNDSPPPPANGWARNLCNFNPPGPFPCYSQYISKTPSSDPTAVAKKWIATLIAAIRDDAHDTQTLITVGQNDEGETRGFDPAAIAETALDYLSVHKYPGPGQAGIDATLADLQRYRQGKPVVIEETFPLSNTDREQMANFMLQSSSVATGWLGQQRGGCSPQQLNNPPGSCGDVLVPVNPPPPAPPIPPDQKTGVYALWDQIFTGLIPALREPLGDSTLP